MDTNRNLTCGAILKTAALLPMAALMLSAFTCPAAPSHKESHLSGYPVITSSDRAPLAPEDTTKNEAIPFALVGNPPKFPGGESLLMVWVSKKLVYPEGAMKRGEKGRVTASFIIDENGKVMEGRIERGVSADLDAEALRVISMMPDWQPGIKDGKSVRVRYILPITFKLPDPKGNESTTQKQTNSNPVNNAGSVGDNSFDQLVTLVSKAKSKTASPDISALIPLDKFDTKTMYPGGDIALSEFVRKTVQYPLESMKKGVSGRVTVSFFVESDGKVATPAIGKGVSPEINAEALRIVSSMPNWTPATSGGKPVRMKDSLTITFVIPDAAVSKKYGVNFRNTDPEISKPAMFSNGDKALTKLLAKEMKKIPVIERCVFEGKVDFLVYLDTKGNVMGSAISTKAADQKALAPGVTSAMEDVVQKLPAFKPALIGKNAVNVEYAFSMLFPLTKN